MLLNEGKLVLRAFFARSPDGRMVLFHYYLLGGDTVAPSGLYARLCHAFLVATKLVAMATSLKISKKVERYDHLQFNTYHMVQRL